MRHDFNPQPEGCGKTREKFDLYLMTIEKISDVLALSNDVKITSAFELNIWVESCGSYFDTFTMLRTINFFLISSMPLYACIVNCALHVIAEALCN